MSLTAQGDAAKPAAAAGRPAWLLLLTGSLVGCNFPLGKIAGGAGVSPLLWTLVISLGAATALLPVLVLRRRLRWPRGRTVRYVIIAAALSFVLPNVLLFSVVAQAGAGYTGLMFALSPVCTLALAALLRLETPGRAGVLGIVVGLAGAVLVSVTRAGAPGAPPMLWTLAAALIPVLLAAGNIYRSMDWPEDAVPDALAFWSHAFAVLVLLALLLLTRGWPALHELSLAPAAALTQALVAGLTFPAYFRLQRAGGPVLLSQIGYVAAAVGLLAATWLLGERYDTLTWLGAVVIAVGIGITLLAHNRAA